MGLLLVAAVLPWLSGPYTQDLVITVFLYVALAQGWNLHSGFTGYVNFGYAGFMGLGAYIGAIGVARGGLHWLASTWLAGLLTGLFAAGTGAVLLRPRGPYFALATLGLAGTVEVLAKSEYLRPIMEGGTGIPFSPGTALAALYYAVAALAVLACVVTWLVARSPFGLRLLAIREDETAAQAAGVPTTIYKVAAFTMSGMIAGLAGALQAMRLTFVDPESAFDIGYTLTPMIMTIAGGTGSVVGPVVGAVTLTLLAELVWSRFLTAHFAIFGGLLVLVVLLLPEGLIPRLQRRHWLPRVRGL